jgi:hypothetical protein
MRHHAPGEEPEPVRLRSSLATNLLALVFVLYVLCWNLTTVSAFTLPEHAAPLGPFLGLDQSWGMFAPSPSSEDGWFVMPGNLRDGQRVDLMPVTRDDYRPHGVSWEKPQDITSTFENEHWRKYLENIYSAQHADKRPVLRPVHLPRVERPPHGRRHAHYLPDHLHAGRDAAGLPAVRAGEGGTLEAHLLGMGAPAGGQTSSPSRVRRANPIL